MRSIMLAVSFLKKQWVMNVVLVVEILISVIMLSELFLFVSDRMDNQRAAEELQNNHLYVLSEFEYYAPQEERVMEALRADEAIQSIGKVDISSCTWNGQYFQLGLYNANLIGLYAPKCASGAWLPTEGGEYSVRLTGNWTANTADTPRLYRRTQGCKSGMQRKFLLQTSIPWP